MIKTLLKLLKKVIVIVLIPFYSVARKLLKEYPTLANMFLFLNLIYNFILLVLVIIFLWKV
jgi:hypothetical protein